MNEDACFNGDCLLANVFGVFSPNPLGVCPLWGNLLDLEFAEEGIEIQPEA